MTKAKNKNDLPSFRYPPVVEVVVGIQFAEPLDIRTLDVAQVWEAIGKKTYSDYKELKRLDPILPSNVMHLEISDRPDLPRYLFKKHDGTGLIQFQRDRFVYNWTRPEEASPEDYPRYNQIIKDFLDHYKKIVKALKANKRTLPTPAVMELTYVNLIECGDDNMSGAARVFKDIKWVESGRFLPTPNRMNLTYGFKIDDIKATLTANMGLVQLVKDGRNMLKLELSVKGPLQDHADTAVMNWCNTAREWIVKGFEDLTTPEMHKKWEKQT